LDWVGKLPGKRENVRYVGDYILTQGDIEKLGNFEDIIGHGGWPMDDHHPEAFYAEKPSTIYNTTPACYGIPYRILYSKNIDNLFFAGRNVSCTHLGMSSTRVMGTCAVMGQAVGSAVAIAVKEKTTPREIYTHHIEELQDILMEQDQFIPFLDRKISSLSLLSKISHEVLRSRMDRFYDDEDNGIWIKLGESCYYEFDNLEKVFSARIIFDSDFTDRKCMPVTEGVEEDDIKSIPGTIARDFVLEYRKDGTWKQVAKIKENRKRYCRIDFDSVEADAFRLIPLRSWNENADSIHLFNFEVN